MSFYPLFSINQVRAFVWQFSHSKASILFWLVWALSHPVWQSARLRKPSIKFNTSLIIARRSAFKIGAICGNVIFGFKPICWMGSSAKDVHVATDELALPMASASERGRHHRHFNEPVAAASHGMWAFPENYLNRTCTWPRAGLSVCGRSCTWCECGAAHNLWCKSTRLLTPDAPQLGVGCGFYCGILGLWPWYLHWRHGWKVSIQRFPRSGQLQPDASWQEIFNLTTLRLVCNINFCKK